MLFKSSQTVYRIYAVMGMISGLAFVLTTFLAGRHAAQIYPVLGMVVGFAFAIVTTFTKDTLLAEAGVSSPVPAANVGMAQRVVASLFRYAVKLAVLLTIVVSLYSFAAWLYGYLMTR